MSKTTSRWSSQPWLAMGAVAALLFCQSAFSPAFADPDRSYQAVRAWLEENRDAKPDFKPGEHLTIKDIERIKPFLPQPAWEYYFFNDMDMEMAATGTYPPPADWGKSMKTDYYLDEWGALFGFNGGGYPFSDIKPDDPLAALKIYWNTYWHPGHGDFFMPMVAWGRSVNGSLDREFEFVSTNAEYAKGESCLVPGYEGVKSKSIMEFRSPRDLAGTRNLQIEYTDPYKENDAWLYSPTQRKPRRVLSSERTSETQGMDFIREDAMGFGGKVHEQKWAYLGKKWVLATMNVATHPEAGGPNLWVPNKTRWEARLVHVLELTPRRETHPYGHKLIYIDAETYWNVWLTAYDKQGQLLRLGQDFLKYSESYANEEAKQAPYVQNDYSKNLGENVFLHVGNNVINAQKPHGTYTHCYVVHKEVSSGRAKQFYSVRNMVSGRR